MDQGEEAGTATLKEDRLDFALWKAHKEGEDTSWDSPWGAGRPGWHIECSAMAEAELGPSFAVHGGGSDLVFPHHENEIAQSVAAGRPFARAWMHNGMVELEAEKMSKSEGNIFQLSEALDRFGRDAVLAYLVSGHYRQPLAFGEEALREAAARVERLRNFLRDNPPGPEPSPQARAFDDRFREALAEDFNTPKALAEAFGLVSAANQAEIGGAGTALASMLDLLGLGSLAEAEREAAGAEAEALLAEREEARGKRDFERADAIRKRLDEMGWEVRDTPQGARLVRRG
jgi:cysteinyl-tRNA synthetase